MNSNHQRGLTAPKANQGTPQTDQTDLAKRARMRISRYFCDREWIYKLITKLADEWAARQDQLVAMLHKAAVSQIQCAGEAHIPAMIEEIHDEYPDLATCYPEAVLTPLAQELLAGEFPEVGEFFTMLYAHFNCQFFDGSLPAYRVRVMHNVPAKLTDYPKVLEIDAPNAQLAIAYNGWPELMVQTLLSLMMRIPRNEKPTP